jgi:hypothetical protein
MKSRLNPDNYQHVSSVHFLIHTFTDIGTLLEASCDVNGQPGFINKLFPGIINDPNTEILSASLDETKDGDIRLLLLYRFHRIIPKQT